ncbi:MAG: metallophosphoesterase [Bacteroidales bacterium]|nr:metallophosphoesterase [Bacteroidales bacterium]
MSLNFFVSDLHGKTDRYEKLFQKILEERPDAVFLGGDLLPSGIKSFTHSDDTDFVQSTLVNGFNNLKEKLKNDFPRIFIILGNDDGRSEEQALIEAESKGILEYIHNRKVNFGEYTVYGYSYVPPTPFLLKDWERYDVSRYVDPGCVPPEDGYHTVGFDPGDILYNTIQKDIELLVEKDDLSRAIFLFHAPPYKTYLDRAALDDMIIDHVPLDVHVGSTAIKRFIEEKQPLLTLHGHIHESARLTGRWNDILNKTFLFSAAHDGRELALIRFNPDKLIDATRELI